MASSPAPGKSVPRKPAPIEAGPALHRDATGPAFLFTPRPRHVEFWESLKAVLAPRPSAGRWVIPAFQKVWVEGKFPARPMTCSVLWHIWLVTFPFFIAPYIPYHPSPRPSRRLGTPRIELTWYAPAPNLPEVSPGPSSPLPKREVARGATAYHPRQTIISRPLKINHPRQTLIQPRFPPPPKDMNVHLPNIVLWPVPLRGMPRPKLALAGGLKLPKARPQVALPEAPNAEHQPAPFNLVPQSGMTNLQPSLSLEAGRVVARTAQEAGGPGPEAPSALGPAPIASGPAGGGLDQSALDRLIALSANPAPPSSGIQIPEGSLGAEIAIGPMGTKPGWPSGDSRLNVATAGGGPGGAGTGAGTGSGDGAGTDGPQVPGVSITGGNGPTSVFASLPAHPEPAPRAPILSARADIPRPELPPTVDRAQISELEKKVFGIKKIYTLTVNMPNLTSVSGSWIVAFSELNEPVQNRAEPPEASGPTSAPPAKSLRAYLSTNIAELAGRLAPGPAPSGGRAGAAAAEHAARPAARPSAGDGPADSPRPGGVHKLTAPFPARKVDPKYPPEMMRERIEGEVVLYAIIRRDGSVDSVRVIRSLDSRLDDHAMRAFGRWTFEPARVNGEAVDLEALVHIPFRYQPLF